MPRLSYIALLRAHMCMLNHHCLKSPFSPVFVILRVKPFVSTINISALVASAIRYIRSLIGIGSMLLFQRSRVRAPHRVTILKFSLSFFVKLNFIKAVFCLITLSCTNYTLRYNSMSAIRAKNGLIREFLVFTAVCMVISI